MSRNRKVSFELDQELEITAEVTPFVRGNSVGHYYGPTPDEPSEVESLAVIISIGGDKIDITDLLTKKALKEVEALCFDAAAEDDRDYDRED